MTLSDSSVLIHLHLFPIARRARRFLAARAALYLPCWLIHSFTVLNSEPYRPNQTKPTWLTYPTYFSDPPKLPFHLKYPPTWPTHLSVLPTYLIILTHTDNLPQPTDNLPEPTDNLPEPTDNLPELSDNLPELTGNLSHYRQNRHYEFDQISQLKKITIKKKNHNFGNF